MTSRKDIIEASEEVMKRHEVTFLKLRISELEEQVIKYRETLTVISEDLASYDGLIAMAYKNLAKETLK